MKRINLIFWKDGDNFGDLLSPFIIERLSGKKTIHKDLYNYRKLQPKDILHAIFHRDCFKIRENLFPWQNNLMAIGSILRWGNNKTKIWGSGFLYESDSFNGGKIYALRGEYSNYKLKKMGYKGCDTFGDPALLLPMIVPCHNKPKKLLGIIPHLQDFNSMPSKKTYYDIINLKTTDIIDKINEITSYHYILSTSLHGIIVAHAYGIPAIWIQQNKIDGDGIKFKDYFSSVNIPIYQGFRHYYSIINSQENVISFFEQNKKISLPRVNISSIQKKLIEVAPFPILPQYQKFY